MKNIVITDSTQGIGYGFADSFLALGCPVAVSGPKLMGRFLAAPFRKRDVLRET